MKNAYTPGMLTVCPAHTLPAAPTEVGIAAKEGVHTHTHTMAALVAIPHYFTA
jgi:hypothetical protein